MAVSVSGTMTLSTDVSPIHDATTITALLGKSPEQLTVKQFTYLCDSIKRIRGGEEPAKTLAMLFGEFAAPPPQSAPPAISMELATPGQTHYITGDTFGATLDFSYSVTELQFCYIPLYPASPDTLQINSLQIKRLYVATDGSPNLSMIIYPPIDGSLSGAYQWGYPALVAQVVWPFPTGAPAINIVAKQPGAQYNFGFTVIYPQGTPNQPFSLVWGGGQSGFPYTWALTFATGPDGNSTTTVGDIVNAFQSDGHFSNFTISALLSLSTVIDYGFNNSPLPALATAGGTFTPAWDGNMINSGAPSPGLVRTSDSVEIDYSVVSLLPSISGITFN